MKPLLILGTHLLALEMADLISEMPGWRLEGFVENLDRDRCSAPIDGLPVHWIDDIAALARTHHAICGISTTRRTRFVEQAGTLGMPFATLVHPGARVSGRSTLGPGTFLSAGVIVAAYTAIGSHVFANRGVLVGHHATVGDFVTLQPGANVAGATRIGEGTYLGMSAVVRDRVRIGKGCVIGAGAVVTADLPDRVKAVGVPARVVAQAVEPK